jgi:hypothetical protein
MRINPVLSLTLLLLMTAIIYYPALGSIFLLDDLQNLKDLAEIQARGMAYYLFASDAGPGGRPLSLLTFALQHPSWPGNPFAFKLVNLLLHLGNGAIIFYICRLLFPALRLTATTSTAFAMLVTALWLLHPLQLSTVLYVVQRMTILATTFMLLGMLLYLHGRQLYLAGKTGKGIVLALGGTYLCMLLAILSKEIGILLPFYLLVLEFTLLTDGQAIRRWRRYSVPVLLLPVLLLSAYLLSGFDGLLAAYQIREYTMGQRLLTEANVLIDYLRLILLPVAGSFSIFHDDYRVATSLFSPSVTFINIAIIVLLIVVALMARKKAVVFSFAILWFFTGHLLESSFIGLELYFEHRNYLPAVGIIFLLIWGLIKISEQIKSRLIHLSIVPTFLFMVLMGTLLEINLWSQPYLQAHEWVRQHPQSKRAVNNLLNISLITNNSEVARDALTKLADLDEADIYPVIKEITIRSCYDREPLTPVDWLNYNDRVITAEFRGLGVVSELGYLLYQYNQGTCPMLEINNLGMLIGGLVQNPAFNPVLWQLYEMAATVAVIQGDLDLALSSIDMSISISPVIDSKIFKLRILLATRDTSTALRLLAEIKSQLQTMPRQYLVYRNIINELEQQLLMTGNER